MVKEQISLQMEMCTLVSMNTANHMGLVSIAGKMELVMLVILQMGLKAGTASGEKTNNQTATITMVIS